MQNLRQVLHRGEGPHCPGWPAGREVRGYWIARPRSPSGVAAAISDEAIPFPGIGILTAGTAFELYEACENTTALKTFSLNNKQGYVDFNDDIQIPLKPFAGVMGVAPDTDKMLNTTPPRANGGNLDDLNLTVGTTVYFPVFLAGALFSIGDTHAVQGLGEVSGTAMEAPMRIVYRISVVKSGTDATASLPYSAEFDQVSAVPQWQ